jgi:hypothetical protein
LTKNTQAALAGVHHYALLVWNCSECHKPNKSLVELGTRFKTVRCGACRTGAELSNLHDIMEAILASPTNYQIDAGRCRFNNWQTTDRLKHEILAARATLQATRPHVSTLHRVDSTARSARAAPASDRRRPVSRASGCIGRRGPQTRRS